MFIALWASEFIHLAVLDGAILWILVMLHNIKHGGYIRIYVPSIAILKQLFSSRSEKLNTDKST
jgi:hypothetical protein